MKKILYIITQSEIGGAQRYLINLAQHLDKKRYELHVAAQETPGEIFEFFAPHAKIHPLHHLQRKIHFAKDKKALTEIRNLIREIQPDIIHLLSSKAGFLGSLAACLEKNKLGKKPRIIYRIGGYAFHENISWWKKIIFFCAEFFSGFWKDVIIVNNEADLKAAKKFHLFPSKTVLIQNGLNPNIHFFSREEARKGLNLEDLEEPREKECIIGTIANFYKNKGLLDLLAAAKIVKEKNIRTKTVIIGEGIERKKLEQYIEKNHLESKVTLIGKKKNAEQYLKAFGMFVLPSEKEGMPWVILEAFAARIPVIATNVGGIPSMIVHEKEGLLVPPKNPAALANAIQKMKNMDPARKDQMIKNAYTKLQNDFNLEKMIEETEKLYSQET